VVTGGLAVSVSISWWLRFAHVRRGWIPSDVGLSLCVCMICVDTGLSQGGVLLMKWQAATWDHDKVVYIQVYLCAG